MFGYIAIHKPELKVREYEAYQAAYCGLCRSLKRRHGRLGQMTLSFDMTFLALLLTGLYEPETRNGIQRCAAHPLHRHPYRENPYYDYAADMNVILTYYKCLDDWEDERRLSGLLYARLLKGRMKKLKHQYGVKVSKTGRLLLKLRAYERKNGTTWTRLPGFSDRSWWNCSYIRKTSGNRDCGGWVFSSGNSSI